MLKTMVRDWGLRVLAFTLDNGFITDQSKANIARVAELLDVDHLFFRPSQQFMTRMYRQAVVGDLHEGRGNYQTRISDICLACISVVNAYAARLAVQNGAPMIFAGFTPGQIPRAVIQNPQRFYSDTYQAHRDHLEDRLGTTASRYLDVPEPRRDLYQMSPFLVYEKSEAVILEQIRELGWEHPEGLDGCTSNCALNVVGNICHQKKFGFPSLCVGAEQNWYARDFCHERKRCRNFTIRRKIDWFNSPSRRWVSARMNSIAIRRKRPSMCGIVGGVLPDAVRQEKLGLEMLEQIRYRGPDAGYLHMEPGCLLGLRRLAIVQCRAGETAGRQRR